MVRQKQQNPTNLSGDEIISSSGSDDDEVASSSSSLTVSSSSSASHETRVSSEREHSPVVGQVMRQKPCQAEMLLKSRSSSPLSSNVDETASPGEQPSPSPIPVRGRKVGKLQKNKCQSQEQGVNNGKQFKPSKKASEKKKSNVLEEIAFYRKTTHLLLQKRPFERVVREIIQNMAPGFRVGGDVCDILQEAAEAFLVGRFEDGLLLVTHAKRTTLMVKDLQLAKRLAYAWE